MYIVPVEIKESPINGRGVFTLYDIPKGQMVWQFTKGHDLVISAEEFEKFDEKTKEQLQRVAYLSPTTNAWVSPPEDDPARFTNHSKDNNLTAVFDAGVSEEPYFIANRDIKTNEELTNNYLEFDKIAQTSKPTWT